MKTSERLRLAKALIEDKKHWTTGAEARDKHGNQVPFTSDEACRFCAIGALFRAEERIRWDKRVTPAQGMLQSAAAERFPYGFVTHVNDKLGHEAVMRLYDAAIELAESEGE